MTSDKGFALAVASVVKKSAKTVAMADFLEGGEVSGGPDSAPEDEVLAWASMPC